jgi:hypothetical protein
MNKKFIKQLAEESKTKPLYVLNHLMVLFKHASHRLLCPFKNKAIFGCIYQRLKCALMYLTIFKLRFYFWLKGVTIYIDVLLFLFRIIFHRGKTERKTKFLHSYIISFILRSAILLAHQLYKYLLLQFIQ